jgi:hypothetical protein
MVTSPTGIATWLLHSVALSASTAVLLGVGTSGALFGLVQRTLQTPALGMSTVLRIASPVNDSLRGRRAADRGPGVFRIRAETYQLRDALAALVLLN